jgi:hypothetical protein
MVKPATDFRTGDSTIVDPEGSVQSSDKNSGTCGGSFVARKLG